MVAYVSNSKIMNAFEHSIILWYFMPPYANLHFSYDAVNQ